MPWEKHEDDCPGCRPAIFDVVNKVALPDSHPLMKQMLTIWNNTTKPEREAYHRVMCNNSRDPSDVTIVKSIVGKLGQLGGTSQN